MSTRGGAGHFLAGPGNEKMVTRRHYALIGAFVIVLGTAFIGITLWLAFGDFTRDYQTYLIYMEESVSGLYVDAPVKFRGVEVGRVNALDLRPDNPQQVRITLAIESGVPITVDTVATLAFQGLTGIASVDLSGGRADSPLLQPRPGEEYPILKTGPSLFTRFDTVVSEVIANLNLVAQDAHELMNGKNLDNAEKILANLESVTGALAVQRERLEGGVEGLAELLDNGGQASAQLPALVTRLDQTAEAVRTMAEDIAGTSRVIREGVQASRRDLRGLTRQTLPEFQSLLAEIRELVGSLRQISRRLEEDPRRILYGPTLELPGPGE
jgi:phospholipid/cholesterol/gamma-HCH transport system substrate-binding protein